ncbi:Alpha/Beta hydrolase protein [Schizophyllum commune]
MDSFLDFLTKTILGRNNGRSDYMDMVLRKAPHVALGATALYLSAVGLLSVPYIQKQALYCNGIRHPRLGAYVRPEKYGLAPSKTLNVQLPTPDGQTLGAWFILSDAYYHSILKHDWEIDLRQALSSLPTILYLHDAGASRSAKPCVAQCSMFSSRLSANVFAIDYRGFGDSTGAPSEEGLATDARAAWEWLLRNGANPADVVIVGQALGSSVAARLGAEIEKDGLRPRGIVLLSPFSSVKDAARSVGLHGSVPFLKPLNLIPKATDLLLKRVKPSFDTLAYASTIKIADILIAHSEDDPEIPLTHPESLFHAFLSPLLPPEVTLPSNPGSLSKDDWDKFTHDVTARRQAEKNLVITNEIRDFGVTSEFVDSDNGDRRVMLVKTLAGGHDAVGLQEGVQDVMGKFFGFLP